MLLLLIACAGSPAVTDTAWWPPCTDADGDYWCVEDGDCDDAASDVNPGIAECSVPADGADDNCDGVVDECE